MVSRDSEPARKFAALSSDDRILIVLILGASANRDSRGYGVGLSIAEVARRTELSRFSASRHLRILRESGLVRASRSGQELRHSLHTGGLEELEDWLYLVTDPVSSAVKNAVPSEV